VFPTLKMHRDDDSFIKTPGQFKTFVNGHSQMSRADVFHYCCSHKQNYHPNIKSLCNFFYTFIPNRIASNINGTLLFVFKIQYKTRYRTAVAINWSMPAG